MLDAVASTADALLFGYSVTDEALRLASTRVRAFVGQQITEGNSVILVRGPKVRLPERPVTLVNSVTDDDDNELTEDEDWRLDGQWLTLPSTGQFTVDYDHGWATVPDKVLEIVCTAAARLGGVMVHGDSGLGYDAWRGLMGLTAEEKAVLRRVFPTVPRSIVLGS